MLRKSKTVGYQTVNSFDGDIGKYMTIILVCPCLDNHLGICVYRESISCIARDQSSTILFVVLVCLVQPI